MSNIFFSFASTLKFHIIIYFIYERERKREGRVRVGKRAKRWRRQREMR